MGKWTVKGWLSWVWTCDCPDCDSDNDHVEDPILVAMEVVESNETDAIYNVQETVENREQWDDSEWKDWPEVRRIE